MPRVTGILETSLYVADVEQAAKFYEAVFGFQRIDSADERGCAMQAGNSQVLLLFKKGASLDHTASYTNFKKEMWAKWVSWSPRKEESP